MALLLREADVENLLTMRETMDLVERVHREYSTGQALDVPRERTRLPKAALQVLQGAVPSAGVLGYKAYTSSREGIRFIVYAFNAERGNLDALEEFVHTGRTQWLTQDERERFELTTFTPAPRTISMVPASTIDT